MASRCGTFVICRSPQWGMEGRTHEPDGGPGRFRPPLADTISQAVILRSSDFAQDFGPNVGDRVDGAAPGHYRSQ